MIRESEKYVFVNGAKIDRQYFKDNILEAKRLVWQEIQSGNILNHHHCMICSMAISSKTYETAYHSGYRWLCDYCYDHFIKPRRVAGYALPTFSGM
jgi:hypothetical protein